MNLALKKISLPLAPFTLEVDAEIKGRVTVIFGPSGAGKTSLLDCIAFKLALERDGNPQAAAHVPLPEITMSNSASKRRFSRQSLR